MKIKQTISILSAAAGSAAAFQIPSSSLLMHAASARRNYPSSSTSSTLYSSPLETETNSDDINESAYNDIETFQRDSRAGEDGYSLLRRPVTFDADVDPTFAAPRVLDEKEEEQLNDANKNWYEERNSGGQNFGRKKDQSNSIMGEFGDLLQNSNNDDAIAKNNNKKLQATRQNEEDQHLDMTQRTLETLDYPLVLRALAKECSTVKGQEIVLKSHSSDKKAKVASSNKDVDDDIATMSLTASNVDGVHHRYGAVQEMQRLMEGRVSGWVTSSRQSQQGNNNKGKKKAQRKPLGAPPIDGHTFDLEPIFDIVDEGKVLEGPEILDITEMLEIAYDVLDWSRALKDFNEDEESSSNNDDLQQDLFVELPRLTQSITIDDELFHLLTNAFDDEGKLSGTTFPGIGRLRAKVRTYKRDILSSIESILSLPSMKSKLAVDSGGSLTMEINGRLVIPVQQSYSNSVGIVHDASRSGKTAYVEPSEIVGPTNELRQAEAELRAEEARVWRQLTEMIVQHRDEIERNVASVGQLDVAMARVKLGKRLEGVVPTVAEDGVVSVKEARHPILLLRGLEGVVGSDVDIGQDGNMGLILTGPNSGGKTIVLKLLGLFALMVRDAIPVPSKSHEPARVDFFSSILADIGDIQSVDSDLSTFSGHMLVCREVLAGADRNALVLMDELGSGTDPNQGQMLLFVLAFVFAVSFQLNLSLASLRCGNCPGYFGGTVRKK